MTEDEIRGLLRELRDEPVPADSLARVRLAVAAGSEARGRAAWFTAGWKVFAGLAATAALAVMVMMLRPVQQPTAVASVSTTVPVAASAHPAEDPVPPTVRKPAVRQRRFAKRQVRQVSPSVNAVQVVRIETADPDVVILLVGD